jgi:hypothetical protein
MSKKYYKGTYNQECRKVKFEVGKTYTLHDKPILCNQGFHYCEKPDDVFIYYAYNKDFELLEIEPLGEVEISPDKFVTNKIKILRVVPEQEYNNIFQNSKYDKNNNLIYFKDSEGYEKVSK